MRGGQKVRPIEPDQYTVGQGHDNIQTSMILRWIIGKDYVIMVA